MKNLFKLTRLWVASLLLLFGISPNLWGKTDIWYATPYDGKVDCNIKTGGGAWKCTTMTKTSNRYQGLIVYECDMQMVDGGLNNLEFWEGGYNSTKYEMYAGGWKTDAQNHLWKRDKSNVGSWSYDPVFNYAFIRYNVNNAGSNSEYKFEANKSYNNEDLGTITTSFIIKEMYLNFSKNGGNVCGGHLGYKNDGEDDSFTPSWGWNTEGEIQAPSANYEVAKSTDASGKYTFEFWWKLTGDYADGSTNCDNAWYIANNNNNFKWTYTILPPAVSNFGVTPSGAVAGTGTSSDPFIMPYDGTLTLTVNSLSQAHTDANSSLSLTGTKKGSSTSSIEPTNNVFTISGIQNTSSIYSVTISAKYHNSSANLDGAESTVTYYYKVGRYTLTLNDNGGSGGSTSSDVNYGGSTFTATHPTRTGYTWNGYYDAATDGVQIAKNSTNTLLANTQYTDANGKWNVNNGATLYAGWKAKNTSVTLDKQGGSGGKSSVTATYDAAMPDAGAVPDKTGYDFGGYFDGQDGTGTKYYNADCSSAHIWDKDVANATLYAYWTPKSYTITLRQTSATTQGATSTTVYYNTVPTQITSLPTRTGYTFGGYETSGDVLLINATGVWQANVDGFTDADGKWIKTTTATLDPIWNPITTTITLNMNGGDEENQEISATFDATLDISGIDKTKVTKTGYSFNGFYTAATNGNYIINENWVVRTTQVEGWLTANGIWKNPNTSGTLYVQWTPNNYTITLNNSGADIEAGTASVTATFDANTNLTTAITIPEKQFNTFGGYYIDDVQIIDAGGNFVPSVDGYTDASKNWKHAGDVELLAKWTPSKQCIVTFGITDGTATAAYGTLSATVNDVAFTSGSQVPSGTTIVFTWANANGSYSSGTAYTFGKWYDDVVIDGANELILTKVGVSDYVWSYTITDDIRIYQAPTVNTYTITSHTANPVAGGEVTADSWNVGPAVPCNVTATAKPGYTFTSWTLGDALVCSSAAATLTTSPITVHAKNSGNYTITANFSANTNTAYTVKHYKQNLDDSYPTEPTETDNLTGTTDTEVTPSTKEYEGFTAPSTQTVTIAGDGTTVVEYRYTRNSHILTWAGLVGATITAAGTPAGSVKFDTPLTAPTVEKTGYTFNGWNPEVAATMPDNDVTYTAQWIEIKSALSTAVNAMGTTAGQTAPTAIVNQIGVTTTATITAEAAKSGYKFEGWTLTNCARTDGGAEKATTITVNGLGNTEAATVTANYNEDLSTGWYFVSSKFSWNSTSHEFIKKTGESTGTIGYCTITMALDEAPEFKIGNGTKLYANSGDKDNKTTMVADNCTGWTFDKTDGNYANSILKATIAGEYTIAYNSANQQVSVTYPQGVYLVGSFNSYAPTHPFVFNGNEGTVTVNLSEKNHVYDLKICDNGVWYRDQNQSTIQETCDNWQMEKHMDGTIFHIESKMNGDYVFTYNKETKILGVSYPGETKTDVTVYLDGETASTVQVGEATHPTIEAVQYVNGKRFAGWQADEGVTLASTSNRTTQITAVSGAGKSVRATYNTDYMVYFKNTPGWDNVYVFFYKQEYYDSKTGTGAWCKDSEGNLTIKVAEGYTMTRLNNKSDIWYYDYSALSETYKTRTIAFNDHFETNNEWFDACQAAYRTDWDRTNNLSVFVPEKNITEKKNNDRTAYYNKGYWMKYDDLQTGYYLRISKDNADHEFVASSAGEPYKTTINLEGSQTYTFKINGCNGSYYSNDGTMTSDGSHSGWDFYEGVKTDCRITTSSAGDYTFTLTFGDGILYVSVEYPLSQNDYRVVYTDSKHPGGHPSTFIRKRGDGAKDTVSFFIDKAEGKNAALKFQYCSNISGSTVTWEDVVGGTINISDITATGIYNFYLEQTESSISCTNHALYEGDFYIRTAIAAGAWDAYKGSADNLLPYIEYGLDESQPFKFTHAYTNWVEKDKNVKFCIANDYSLCISDTLVGDDVIGIGENADWLNKEGANIRFMWNKNTNEVMRAYIGGSTDDAAHFLMLIRANGNMFNSSDEAIDELKFADKNNWVYQADIKAQPGCAVKLTANYNEHTQYFIGAAGDGAGSSKTIIKSSAEDAKLYTMRAVYDFKTNRLTAGWIPDDGPISSQIELGGDMLISRTHQGNAQQITFGTGGEVSEIQHIYGVLTLQKDVMAGTAKEEYKDKATNADYDKTMYWISFPFDVNISEIFGVDGYGKKWIMQKYRGDLRAQKGWFAETSTFWEYMDISEKLNAYEGYLFIVDANYFNTLDADVWKSSATEANFYFPSAEKNIGIINESSVTITVPEHECLIDRTFGVNNEKNHKITDSHWNVIGVPTFQNSTASTINETDNDFKSYYEWNPTTNGYNVQAALNNTITFNTMKAYMVQYAGTITWENVSVVAKKAPYAYVDDKNYMIELFFNGNGAEDHTYINLADGAHTDFELNEDMMKIDNAGQPNIYSFAGAYNVAYNETTFDNQMVVLGVSAPKDGSYTFAMPKEFSGTAKLIDLVEGTTTDLNVSNYSVDLEKGTYNSRFQLLLEVEAKAPTSIEADGQKGREADGKTQKLLRNGNIYLINAGRVYNATGAELR